jgi:spore maturation protein CgeB
MRVLVCGPQYYNYPDSVAWALAELGHEAAQCNYIQFAVGSPYWMRKLHKWGYDRFECDHLARWESALIEVCTQFRPDRCLILNGNWISPAVLERLRNKGQRITLWMIDSISRMPETEHGLRYYDRIFSFDHRDGPYLLDKLGVHCEYCPVGYDARIYKPAEGIAKDIDVSFVGVPVARRVGILREVAEHAKRRGYRLAAFGHYWDARYFWKKNRFARKQPFLHAYVHNHYLSPKEAASVYQRSKICLNIHIPDHEGVNPRTFEILGTGSFQLTDRKPMLDQLLTDGEDVVVYEDIPELLLKIEHYLHAETEREQIAKTGHHRASSSYSIVHSVERILG